MSGVLSKTFSLKHLEDVSSLCNFESENKKSMRLLCVLSKISEMAIDWLQYRRRTKDASTGQVEYDEYYPKLSNPVIDEINKVLLSITVSLKRSLTSSSTTTSNIVREEELTNE